MSTRRLVMPRTQAQSMQSLQRRQTACPTHQTCHPKTEPGTELGKEPKGLKPQHIERIPRTSTKHPVRQTTTPPDAPRVRRLRSSGSTKLTARERDQLTKTSTSTSCALHDLPYEAKVTTDQGDRLTTSASAPNVLHDHPDQVAETTDLARPSASPADATGDDEHRPDAPTELPDQPEGTRERSGEQRVEKAELRELRELRESRGRAGCVGDVDDDGESFGEPHEAVRDPTHVQLEPGGEVNAE
ncbi:hypothetical protein OG21DRAFT_1528030 [Imleria badia]|nr:hypothetical protein OG21DRAFT_1528030 [Imleria badia]